MLRGRSLSTPRLVGELIRRMTRRELMELSRYVDWEEIEEWKATAEVAEDGRLCRKIRKGLLDEKRGRVKPARSLMGS